MHTTIALQAAAADDHQAPLLGLTAAHTHKRTLTSPVVEAVQDVPYATSACQAV